MIYSIYFDFFYCGHLAHARNLDQGDRGMKNKLFALLVVVLIVIIASCSLKAKDDDTDTGGAQSVSEVLKNIPEVKPALPKSLQLSESAKYLRSSKAADDITELTTANVSPVKSQAWVDLQEGDDVQLMFNRAVKFIANYATANDIAIDQEFSAPIDATALADIFKIPANMASGMTVSNRCVIKGTNPKDIVLYCKISINNGHATIPISAKVGIKTADDSSVRLTVNLDIATGGGMNQRMYVDFDSTTSACTSVVSMQDSSGADQGTFIRTATLGSDGSISTVNRSTGSSSGVNPMPGFTHIAYGDDNYGGIASLFSSLDSTTNDFYYGEYYNSSGNLIRRDSGNSSIWVQPVENQQNLASLGLSSTPQRVYIREKWNSTDSKSEYQYSYSMLGDGSDSTAYVDLPGYGYTGADKSPYIYGLYFKNNPAAWNIGDGIYQCEKIESISEGDYIGRTTYYLGYKVPATTNLFGKNLYLDYEYPLNSLLPIVGNYKLLQKQIGESSTSTWTDWDGNSITNTFAFYIYYLNSTLNGTTTLEPGLDIDLSNNLREYDVYYFSGGKLSKVKGYFFRTSQDLPAYFTPPTAAVSSAIGGVKAKLTDLMNTALALDSADYASLLVSLASDSVLGGLTL